MSEFQPATPATTQRNWAVAVYVLYLVSSITGITAIIGVIMAHIKVNESDPVWRSHFAFQIRTFWWSLLFFLISFLLVFIVIGIPLLVLVGLWFLVRCIVGLIRASDGRPIPAPNSLLFGL